MRTELDNTWVGILKRLMSEGLETTSRVGDCRELIGVSFQLQYPLSNVVTIPERKLSLAYASAEFIWYLSGKDSIDIPKFYAPSYANYAEENGKAYGAYGYRMANSRDFWDEVTIVGERVNRAPINGQIPAVIDLIRRKPDTRQAVISLWSPRDLVHSWLGDKKDIPCTLSVQFLLRDEALHCITTMRSQDVWLGLPYDVFSWTTLQYFLASCFEVKVGTYTHNVGSLHLYKKHYERVNEILEREECDVIEEDIYDHWWDPITKPISKRCQELTTFEEKFRTMRLDSATSFLDFSCSDLLLACRNLVKKVDPEAFRSRIFAEMCPLEAEKFWSRMQ